MTPPSLASSRQYTVSATYGSSGGPQNHTYMGASLWDVLNSAGIVTTSGIKNDVLNRYLLATGSDGYKVVLVGRAEPELR